MPRGASPKRERQYKHIKQSAKKSGRYGGRAEEVAARTVNKIRSEKGETKSKRSSSSGTPKRPGRKRSASRSTPSTSRSKGSRARSRKPVAARSGRRATAQRSSSRGRGFAGMSDQRQREIAAAGGRAAHKRGTAHEFSPAEARRAGQKGGEAVSRDRGHMARIGRKGGER
jgi:uncharacterized protein